MNHLKKFNENSIGDLTLPNTSKFKRKFVPSGWINVKVDNELSIRISRYVKSLDNTLATRHRANLYEKIKKLGNITSIVGDSKVSMQTKIGIITLLQYLREIKTQFNAPSGGFLLESFLAGLIYGKLEETGFGAADLINDDRSIIYDVQKYELKYQIKFYRPGSSIKVNMNEVCDYYVVALRSGQNVSVNILDGKNINDPSYIGYFSTKIQGTDNFMREDSKGQHLIINSAKLSQHPFKVLLNLDSIDENIEKIGKDVKKSITDVYDAISELHYDVDAVITGVDKFKRNMKIDKAYQRTEKDIQKLQDSLKLFTLHYKDTIYSPSIGIFGGTRIPKKIDPVPVVEQPLEVKDEVENKIEPKKE
jgi:hypothetical protein